MPAGSSRSSTRPRSQPCCIKIIKLRVASGDRSSTSGAAPSRRLLAAVSAASQLRRQARLRDPDRHPEMAARRCRAGRCLLSCVRAGAEAGVSSPGRPGPRLAGVRLKGSNQDVPVSASHGGFSAGAVGGESSGPAARPARTPTALAGGPAVPRAALPRPGPLRRCRSAGPSRPRTAGAGRSRRMPASARRRKGRIGLASGGRITRAGRLAVGGPAARARERPGLFLAHDHAEGQHAGWPSCPRRPTGAATP